MTGRAGESAVVLLGLCSDTNSSFMRGPAEAPSQIRATLHNGASNLCAECGTDIGADPRFCDAGDVTPASDPDGFVTDIEDAIGAVIRDGGRPLSIGGDHAVTYPVLRAIAGHYGPPDILHFDAHPDLYESFEGNRLSHASPFARIMEEGLAQRLVQVGIRTVNDHLREQAARYGVETWTMQDLAADRFEPGFERPLYLSFDLDALDPAAAPGVSHHEPGGLSVRQALTFIQAIKVPVIGADVVEYNPRRDSHGMTASVAAKLVKEIAAVMLNNPEGNRGRT